MKQISFALIGGGPASFYTAKVLSKLPCNPVIHIIEKELCPFGLIRYGVAPDHVSIKRVQINLSDSAHANPNLHFFGNKQVLHQDIEQFKKMYSGIIYAYGASGDFKAKLKIKEGCNPTNIKVARQFVYWYNGHPSCEHIHYDLSQINNVAIIGNGNVAIDVARILLRSPKELAETQISRNALEDLKNSKVRNVQILGRRGVTHAAYSLKEVRELHRLGIKLYAIKQEIEDSLNEASHAEITALGVIDQLLRMNARKINFMKQSFNLIEHSQIEDVLKDPCPKIIFRYLLSPQSINDSSNQLTCIKNTLSGQAFEQRAVPTNERQSIPYELLINSIGFQVESIEGSIPIERTVTTKIDGGTVLNSNKNQIQNSHGCLIKNDKVSIGQYAVGWCKNGAKGVIDQTFLTAQETYNNLRIHYENNLLEPKQILSQQFLRSPGNIFNNTYSFQQYIQLREKQFQKGNKALWIKKKFTSPQIKNFYGLT